MAVIVYLYTVIAFNFFRKFYSNEEDGEVEHNCKDLFTVRFQNFTLIRPNFKSYLVFQISSLYRY